MTRIPLSRVHFTGAQDGPGLSVSSNAKSKADKANARDTGVRHISIELVPALHSVVLVYKPDDGEPQEFGIPLARVSHWMPLGQLPEAQQSKRK